MSHRLVRSHKYLFFIQLLWTFLMVTPAFSQNPVGYWPFDEGKGTKATDVTGSGHTANLVNGVRWTSGQFGGAISATPVGKQFVSIPPIDLSGTKAVTIALWSKRTYSVVGGNVLLEASPDYEHSSTGFAFLPDDPACQGVQASLHGDVGYVSNCYAQPSSGVWHHLALVFDKSQTGGNEVAFYVDGVLQTPSRSLAASTNTNTFGNNPVYLFSRAGALDFDTGSVSDLRIYNSALTAEQIQQIYNSAGLVSLSVAPASVTLKAGEQQRFAALGTYRDGSSRDLSNSVTWTATIPSVAAIDSGGVSLARVPGNTTIMATLARTSALAGVVVSSVIPNAVSTPSISYVQGNASTPQSSATTVNTSFTAAQAAGDLNVVVVGWNNSTSTVSSVTDTKGNIYIRAVGPTVVSGALSQSIYYAKNIASAAAGANTVTVKFSVATPYPDIRILEYHGADPKTPVDVVAANSGNSATSSSGSATTTNATDLIFAANTVTTLTSGAGSGFTSRLLTSPDGDIAEDQMLTSTGTWGASAPLSWAGPWVMQMVAFRTPADFTLSASPASVAVTPGNQGRSTLTTTISGGFNSAITLSASGVPSGTTVSFSPNPIAAPGSGSSTMTINVGSGTPTGNYTITVTGAGGGLQHTATVTLTVTTVVPPQVTLSWTASTSQVVGYNVYRSSTSGGPYTKLNSTLLTGTSYTDTAVQHGATYYYVGTSVDSQMNESAYSNQASATVP